MEKLQSQALSADFIPASTAPASDALAHGQFGAGEPEPRAAAERVAAEMAALTEEEVVRLNVDATAAVTAVLGRWPVLVGMMPQIEALVPADAARVGKLREYALALYHWQSCVLSSVGPEDAVARLVETGVGMRDRALTDLQALANRGLIEPAALQNYKGSNSYRKVALDLAALSALIHDRWPTIGARTLLTLAEADELGRLGHAILEALGGRDRTSSASSAQQQRDRAFTLFQRAYEAARRAVGYLRYYEGDAEQFVPNVYTGRKPTRTRDAAAESPAAATPNAGTAPAEPPPTSSLLVPSARTSGSSPFEVA